MLSKRFVCTVPIDGLYVAEDISTSIPQLKEPCNISLYWLNKRFYDIFCKYNSPKYNSP